VYIAGQVEALMDRKVSLFSESAWEALCEILQEKFVVSPKLIEEDLRYCAVCALESFGMFPRGAIRLDYPHPLFDGKKIDIFLSSYSGRDAIACELKYDRVIRSGHSQPRSMKAGAILNDVLRLAHFKASTHVERFLIYLTDEEMRGYLENPKNGFAPLFNDSGPQQLAITSLFSDSRAASVRKMIMVPPIDRFVFTVMRREVDQRHLLSVLLVKPI
jgi:hypothetical protein